MRRQPQARGSKAKFRIDAFYELDRKSKVRRDDSQVRLNVGYAYIGSKIFEAVDVSKRYGDKVILHNFGYVFARYEKWVLSATTAWESRRSSNCCKE